MGGDVDMAYTLVAAEADIGAMQTALADETVFTAALTANMGSSVAVASFVAPSDPVSYVVTTPSGTSTGTTGADTENTSSGAAGLAVSLLGICVAAGLVV